MCAIDYCDNYFDLCSTSERKARKPHVCSECYRQIMSGEKYFYTTYLSEGAWEINKCCRHCNVGREWLNKHCGGFLFHGLFEDLSEHFEASYKVDNLEEIFAGVKCKWNSLSGELLGVPSAVS